MSANLPSIKRFFNEDFQGSPPWFQRFISQLNLYTDPIYNLLNGSLVPGINTAEENYTLEVTNASATGSANTFLFTPQTFKGTPQGILLGQCLWNTETGLATAIGNSVTFDWVWTGSQVSILAIYGLTAAESYTLNLRIY